MAAWCRLRCFRSLEYLFLFARAAVNAGIAIINIPPPVCEPGPGGAGSVPAAVGSDASRDDVRGDGASMGSPWTLPWALAVIIAVRVSCGYGVGRARTATHRFVLRRSPFWCSGPEAAESLRPLFSRVPLRCQGLQRAR